MKKILFSLAFILLAGAYANAQQISEHALGLRLGHNNGFGAEVSYQYKIPNKANRIEANLGIRSDNSFSAFKASAIYQWVWRLDGNLNWYAGVGGGVGSWKDKGTDTSSSFFFASGDIGIEYNFEIPLLISLDFRPEFGFSDAYDDFNSDIGLSIRYQF